MFSIIAFFARCRLSRWKNRRVLKELSLQENICLVGRAAHPRIETSCEEHSPWQLTCNEHLYFQISNGPLQQASIIWIPPIPFCGHMPEPYRYSHLIAMGRPEVFPWAFCGDEGPIWTCTGPTLPCKKSALLHPTVWYTDVLHSLVMRNDLIQTGYIMCLK
jgi:hypothetical protein